MTEYWVSKKQYWCKYCSIFIRDDAPSRRLHETGLKHLGNKERYIRDLYKNGDMAKREKATQAAEMAQIEASAAAAYAHDTLNGASTSASASRPSVLQRISASAASSSSKLRDTKPADKWANYSTAEQLGFDDAETQKTSYEIEQEIKGRAGEVGKWEEVVVEPTGLYTGEDEEGPSTAIGGKRKWLTGSGQANDDEAENFKFVHDKKVVYDPYDDDWDPSTIKKIKVRVKEEKKFGDDASVRTEEEVNGLQREGWTGKLELHPVGDAEGRKEKREGMRFDKDIGGWVKDESAGKAEDIKPTLEDDVKPTLPQEGEIAVPPTTAASESDTREDVKPSIDIAPQPQPAETSLFKKRRPPPSSRKK